MNGVGQNIGKMKPEQILEMFLEVQQQHPSKSYDFPISNLLDQYMQCRIIPNFPEAAMVINSAGQVYCRKVDYLECMLMAMNEKPNTSKHTDGMDNAEQSDKTEKKRQTKRLKTVNASSATIDLAVPKQIKRSTTTEEKMNLNSSEISDSDRFKSYCQAVKSKTPVFYERVNLLISDAADNCFDGKRPISKDDPDCQKNYSVFVGCLSFKEKQLMSQREFLNRIQFDELNSNFELSVSVDQQMLDSTGMNVGEPVCNRENDILENLREACLLVDNLTNGVTNDTNDCDSAMVDDSSFINSTIEQSTINQSHLSSSAEKSGVDQSPHLNSTAEESAIDQSSHLNSTAEESAIDQSSNFNSTTEQSVIDQSLHLNSTTEQSSMDQSSHLNSTTEQSGMDQSSHLNSTADRSNVSNLNAVNSTGDQSNISNLNGTSQVAPELQASSTLFESAISNSNQIGHCGNVLSLATLAQLAVASLAEINGSTAKNGSHFVCGEVNNSISLNASNSLTLNGSGISDMQIDPLNCDGIINVSEAVNNISSDTEKSEVYNDSRNMFRIDPQYLKIIDNFRLPLNILQQEFKVSLNIFGIPFARLRRQVKFALPKEYDALRTTNKRTRDTDETSTTARKCIKLSDGTVTPAIDTAATLEKNTPAGENQLIVEATDSVPPSIDPINSSEECQPSNNITDPTSIPPPIHQTTSPEACEPTIEITDPSLIPPSAADATELSFQLSNGCTQSIQNDLGIGDCFSDSQTMFEDEPPSKVPRLDLESDVISRIDSGIGTSTGESLAEGTIAIPREDLDLSPSINQIDNEILLEEEELSANKMQEMTLLSEKVSSWHHRLKPILIHSERRNDFDVKETSRSIVKCFTNSDTTFKDVMENREEADTARYFFSILQMANNGNIGITVNHRDSSKLCPLEQIKLRLLDPNIRQIDITPSENS